MSVSLALAAGCAAPGVAGKAARSPAVTAPPGPNAASGSAALSASAPNAGPAASVAASMSALAAPSPAPSAVDETRVDETGAAPWVDAPGQVFLGSALPVTAPPTSGPPCKASDLRVSYFGGNGAGGDLAELFKLTNVGPTACVLGGFPKVVATEPGRPPLTASENAELVGPLDQPATITPGQAGDLTVETYRDCAARYATPNVFPTLVYNTLTASLPGGGAVTLRRDGGFDLECGLSAGKLGLPPPQPSYTTSPVEGASVAIELPKSVKAGTTLRYVVAVTNPTSHDMKLDPCPGYQQGLGVGGKTVLVLNCAAVPVIHAGKTARFAMRLPVPADTPTGNTAVYWVLAGVVDSTGMAKGSVLVDGADMPCAAGQLEASIAGPGFVPGGQNMYAESTLPALSRYG